MGRICRGRDCDQARRGRRGGDDRSDSRRTLCFRSSSRRDTATSGYPFPRLLAVSGKTASSPTALRMTPPTALRMTLPRRERRAPVPPERRLAGQVAQGTLPNTGPCDSFPSVNLQTDESPHAGGHFIRRRGTARRSPAEHVAASRCEDRPDLPWGRCSCHRSPATTTARRQRLAPLASFPNTGPGETVLTPSACLRAVVAANHRGEACKPSSARPSARGLGRVPRIRAWLPRGGMLRFPRPRCTP